MHKKEDFRITKTRAALKKAFFSLLGQYSFSDITVNNLCETAGIRRATFYKHYKDKIDFAAFVISSLGEDLDASVFDKAEKTTNADLYSLYASAMVDYFDRNREFINSIVSDKSNIPLIGMLIQHNYKNIISKLDQLSTQRGYSFNFSNETIAGMLSGGLTVILLKWSENKYKSKGELIEELSAINGRILTIQ